MIPFNLYFILTSIAYNLTNLTTEGILRVAFDPYYSVFGELTWGVVFGFIGAGLYANERSIGTITVYLILVGAFFAVVLPTNIVFVFGLILAFALSVIFYVAFIETKS